MKYLPIFVCFLILSHFAEASPKQYCLVGDYRHVTLCVHANVTECLLDIDGSVPSGSNIWTRLSRLKNGQNRVLYFVAIEEGVSFTGKQKRFPYQLVLEVDSEMRISRGFALMPFWSEPYSIELIGCVMAGSAVADGANLSPELFHISGTSKQPAINYSGVLHL